MTRIELPALTHAVETTAAAPHAGMRLVRCELYNWGTFHGRVWGLDLKGDNTLLTGDIGSGKSTLVDAITTLLVPAQKVSYNRAAGADARERDLKSYVLGHYKSERAEAGYSARPVALRDHNHYSVILGRFRNEGFDQDVTLAQVFWLRELQGQPARFFVVADTTLSATEHFTIVGSDFNALKKRLRSMPGVEVHDTFPPYGAAFRRRFGIDSEQALDLFHQTVSMKSVGNLTDFVRQHMLEIFPVDSQIDALLTHFENLNHAHEAVLKAKAQIGRLQPLVEDCDQYAALAAEIEELRGRREALRSFFAGAKAALLQERLESLKLDLGRLAERITSLEAAERGQRQQRDDIKRAIADNGGDRIESLKKEIDDKQRLKEERFARAEKYTRLAREADIPDATDADAFLANRHATVAEHTAIDEQRAELQNVRTEKSVVFSGLKKQHDEIESEINSLRNRRSNIPARILGIRENLCRALQLSETDLPFIGELVEVRQEERAWEGAAERLLHNYALSVLVPDEHYSSVAGWVERTHLGERVVYYRVRDRRAASHSGLHPQSLVRKLAIRPDSGFYAWIEADITQRFDYACCETLDTFRREAKALTRAGQIKGGGERHEKDNRYRLDDRTRYVLGWSNEAKIAALEQEAQGFQERLRVLAGELAQNQQRQKALEARQGKLQQLSVYESFRDLDWRPLAVDINSLQVEKRQLEEGSDVLRTLNQQLAKVEQHIEQAQGALRNADSEHGGMAERIKQATRLLAECVEQAASASDEVKARRFPVLKKILDEADRRLSVESCDARERDIREHLQSQIDTGSKRIDRQREKIVEAMKGYNDAYPSETKEVDVSVESAPEYRKMLADLVADGLPRFEARFKELLNENTIREIANFQSQLRRERQSIQERIDKINRSLHEIDYNPNRFIVLNPEQTTDPRNSRLPAGSSARAPKERSQDQRNPSIRRRNSCRSRG